MSDDSNIIYLSDRRHEDFLRRENARLKQELANLSAQQNRRRASDRHTNTGNRLLMMALAISACMLFFMAGIMIELGR